MAITASMPRANCRETTEPQVFVPFASTCAERQRAILLIRPPGRGTLQDLRHVLSSASGMPALSEFVPVGSLTDNTVDARRAWLSLAAWGAALAVGVALLTTHAILSREIAARRREHAIRAVLGATIRDLRLRMIRTCIAPLSGGAIVGAGALRFFLENGNTSTSGLSVAWAATAGALGMALLLALTTWISVRGLSINPASALKRC